MKDLLTRLIHHLFFRFVTPAHTPPEIYLAPDHFIVVKGKRVMARIPLAQISQLTAFHRAFDKRRVLTMQVGIQTGIGLMAWIIDEDMAGFKELLLLLEKRLHVTSDWREHLSRSADAQAVLLFEMPAVSP